MSRSAVSQPPRGLFITGTDTGVGKTLVTSALLHALHQLGERAIGMKPVAAGCELKAGEWLNEDVEALRAASPVEAPLDWINPYRFRQAIAPHIAAAQKGVRIEIPRILEAHRQLQTLADIVLVEGVGGFRVPLDAQHDTADLAVALRLRVLLVVGMRLGCLNHALLTAEAIAARKLPLAGWVACRIDPDMPVLDENLDTLKQRIDAPLLAEIPPLPVPTAAAAARFIPPNRLLALLYDTAP